MKEVSKYLSDLARAHADRVLSAGGKVGPVRLPPLSPLDVRLLPADAFLVGYETGWNDRPPTGGPFK